MVQYIFKQKGQRVYRGRYRLQPNTPLIDTPLHTRDKQVALQKLAEKVKEKELEAAGIIAPKNIREAAQKRLTAHLTDFIADLKALGRAQRHITNIEFRVGRLIADCDWKFPCDVTPDSFVAWRGKQTVSPKTLNDYLQAMKGLFRWMERQGRVAANPLISVGQVETRGRETRIRRAFTNDEIGRLLAVAGQHRSVYLTAVFTGLRHSELGALRWGDITLDGVCLHLRVRAAISKNHKTALIPLHKDVVKALRETQSSDLTAPVFQHIPRIERFRRDLKLARIEYRDTQGRYADFHSLRKTFGTNLQRNGEASRTAMTLMRHSDRRLTDIIYTDESLLGVNQAVSNLPSFETAESETPSHIASHKTDANGQKPSTTGTPTGEQAKSETSETLDNRGQIQPLTISDKNGQRSALAGATGLEPATSAVTGQRSKPIELRPHTNCTMLDQPAWWALKDSNL